MAIGLVCARLWTLHLPRPGPSPVEVTISPPAPAQKPDIVIHGRASGPARRTETSTRPQEARIETGEVSNTSGPEIAAPTPEPVAQTAVPGEPEPAFLVGERAEGTIAGEIEVVDQRGRELTTEPVPISGTYSVEFPAPGEAQVELEFDAPMMVSIKEPVHFGASAGWVADEPFVALHAGYEWRREIIGSLEGRVEVEAGWAWTPGGNGPYARAEIGIVYRF